VAFERLHGKEHKRRNPNYEYGDEEGRQQSDDGHFRDGGLDSETAVAVVKTHFPDVRDAQPRITEL
jgi:hypothetical protein